MTDYFEDHRVGAHLRSHREHLGVARSAMIGPAPRATYDTVRFAERAERPAIAIIETYHAALMAAYTAPGEHLPTPLARREQWYATEADVTLWREAMVTNPRVSWWWGVRSDTAPRGAYCHLCTRMIHGYDVGRGLTGRARKAVMAHRLTHIRALTATPAAEQRASHT